MIYFNRSSVKPTEYYTSQHGKEELLNVYTWFLSAKALKIMPNVNVKQQELVWELHTIAFSIPKNYNYLEIFGVQNVSK